MGYNKNAVFSFNGELYFHLVKIDTIGILTSLSDLVSSALITISTPTFALSENLAQTSNNSNLVFNGTTYPLTFNSTTLFNLTGYNLTGSPPLMSFAPKTFSLAFPSSA